MFIVCLYLYCRRRRMKYMTSLNRKVTSMKYYHPSIMFIHTEIAEKMTFQKRKENVSFHKKLTPL